VFKGRQRLDEDEALQALGGNSHLSRGLDSRSLKGIFDQFSLAEGCLLSDVVHYLNQNNITFNPAAVHSDVTSSIAHVHVSGLLHREVMGDVEKYVHRSPKIRTLLEEMKGSVKLFLLSNSSFDYVDNGMRYICGDDWTDLFDVVSVEAQKPSFYNSRNPFRQLDVDSRSSSNSSRRLKWSEVKTLEQGNVYVAGNVSDLMSMTQWNGPEVLYIGDHLFADLRTPARHQGWWTGAIIRELEKEIVKESSSEYQLMSLKMQMIEELMRRLQWAPSANSETNDVLEELNSLQSARAQVRHDMNNALNPNFGSVFVSAAHSPSLFASSMSKYVDIYTSRLENLLDYGMDYRFYPRKGHRVLPHEPLGRPGLASDLLQMSLDKPMGKPDIKLRSELSFRAD